MGMVLGMNMGMELGKWGTWAMCGIDDELQLRGGQRQHSLAPPRSRPGRRRRMMMMMMLMMMMMTMKKMMTMKMKMKMKMRMKMRMRMKMKMKMKMKIMIKRIRMIHVVTRRTIHHVRHLHKEEA